MKEHHIVQKDINNKNAFFMGNIIKEKKTLPEQEKVSKIITIRLSLRDMKLNSLEKEK